MSKKEIKPNAVYTLTQTAELLELSRWGVQPLIKKKLIVPQLVGNKYRILGQNIIDYVSGKAQLID